MSLVQRKVSSVVLAAVLVSVFMVSLANRADAGIIPYSIIAPHDYQFPVGSEIPDGGINVLLSYNTFRDESDAYNGESGSRNLFANFNKFAHFFKIDGLENCGFLWEGVLGFANAQTKDNRNFSGMIDGQTGLVAWHKPTKNWVNALEYWLYLPIGDNELSGHSWDHSIAYLTNYHNGNFTFDGDFGYKLRGDYRDGGIHNEQGNVFFANVVFAYKIMKQLEPFVKLDFQSTESGKNKVTGAKIPGQHELAWGIGNQFTISDHLNLALWYEGPADGRNTTKTNAGYARFIWFF